VIRDTLKLDVDLSDESEGTIMEAVESCFKSSGRAWKTRPDRHQPNFESDNTFLHYDVDNNNAVGKKIDRILRKLRKQSIRFKRIEMHLFNNFKPVFVKTPDGK